MFSFKELADLIGGKILYFNKEYPIKHLLLDSRKILSAQTSLFFAIKGKSHDGHKFISEAYQKGVRQFIVEKGSTSKINNFPDANFIEVESSVEALQKIATWHRKSFSIPIIAITGSNGKTIVKEWLSQLLAKDYTIVKSPKSYNSQVGVPLSVWEINNFHSLGIFEAGLSKPGEMENLEKVLSPTIGIFINLGSAHDEGFSSREQKAREKLKLFLNVDTLIYCKDHPLIDKVVQESSKKIKSFTWGKSESSQIRVKNIKKKNKKTKLALSIEGNDFSFDVPFIDDASVENIIHCICLLLFYKITASEIQNRLLLLHSVAMRLELKEAINNCYLIDDSYNNDLGGLNIALNFLDQQKQRELKTVILSDVLEAGLEKEKLYQNIASLLEEKKVQRLIGVGPDLVKHKNLFTLPSEFYSTTEELLSKINIKAFANEIILVKGARVFQFEKVVQKLLYKVHQTVLEINLDALSHNLNFYRSRLMPNTKIMVMVKAFAYGSGSFEVANLLQFHRIDYLAVAYADEGVQLRENGITLPIMVMNPSLYTFDKIAHYHLEPEIFSFKVLDELISFNETHNSKIKIHLKIDTGMRRLGFEEKDISKLVKILKANPNLEVASVFTHLAGADEAEHNNFSYSQIDTFKRISNKIESGIKYSFIKHALNSAGIVRFPEEHLDMVRLGIGLYGVEATGTLQNELMEVGTLKTIISQIKIIKEGETVGYSRKGFAKKDLKIATIAIGYADGYRRSFSGGKGKVLVNGVLCPIIGNVCMDMCMVDISGVEAEEGDEVIIFGKGLPVTTIANEIGTIPYEILTNVSERVKRVFYSE